MMREKLPTPHNPQTPSEDKIWIVFAVHGDADEYVAVSYHKTPEGAAAHVETLDPEDFAKEEFGMQPPFFQINSKLLKP